MEELAELGAAFLCADLRITGEPRADHAQYFASRLAVLKADKTAIFTASSRPKPPRSWRLPGRAPRPSAPSPAWR
jgi:antirestriction protein ArdC